jgi:two-component system, OmpR family, sensor histidine kinase MtrB
VRGIRTRLALALVALVAVTVTVIGVGTYLFVDARLRDGLIDEASRQAQFNLSVLLPERLPGEVTRDAYASSGLREAFRLRGDVETIVDFGDGRLPDVSNGSLLRAIDGFPATLTGLASNGHLGFAWLDVAGQPALVVGGRQGSGPIFYFVFPALSIEQALEQLRLGLLAAGLVAIALALATAGIFARGILRPVDSGSAAAARIASGDLSARVPVGGADEFARFAAEFNRMADSLAKTVARLQDSEQQNQRFVADVSHELRTPLTALVAEASIIEAGLDRLEPDARRAAELLVADVRRLRSLVEDLMELSRFDANTEQAALEPTELGEAVRSIVRARLPAAQVVGPATPIVVAADARRLDRIIGNLLDNARQHAGDGSVEVAVGADGDRGFVSVADRGPGVALDALGHLFERFYKADPSRHGGSSGLGLAIAAEHAALLNGDLVAANRQGGGLEVTLRLPRAASVTGSLRAGDGHDTPEGDAERGSDAIAAPTEPARPNP